jgi:hypothetical protein
LVFRLQGFDDWEYALANLLPHLVRGLNFFSKFCGPLFQLSVVRGASTIVIDDGVSENAIEPRDDRLFITDRIALFQRSSECRLEDIFGVGRRGHMLSDEREELSSLF